MKALNKWTALNGVSGNKIYLQLDDVICFEEMDISGKPATLIVNRYGVKLTVLHSALELAKMLELDSEELMNRNIEFWKNKYDTKINVEGTSNI